MIRKHKHFYCYKDWFVFPIAVEFHHGLPEYMQHANRLCIHFLWWHWQWTFVNEIEDGK